MITRFDSSAAQSGSRPPLADDSFSLGPLEQLSQADQERLVAILDQYLIDVEEGRQVDESCLLRSNADLAEPLRKYLGGLRLVRQMAREELLARDGQTGDGLPLGTGTSDDSACRDEYGCGNPLGKSDSGQGLLNEPLRPSRPRRPVHWQQPPHSRLGPYELGPVIGRGAMGVVYRAREIESNRTVAVKVLAYGTAFDETRIDRFRREAKTAAMLDHPHVVPVYAVGCARGTHYYAMQLIEGDSLDRRIAAAKSKATDEDSAEPNLAAPLLGPDRYQRIALWGAAAARALHAAHTVGIIHRDIKPSNLLLGNDGQLWVTDFGLARVQTENGLTKSGDLIGTLRYMSPEQAGGQGALIDARTDVYGLGASLYELVALDSAFTGEDVVSVLREIQTSEPPSLTGRAPDVPLGLATIIQRAMRPRPVDRYRSAEDLADDLQRFAEGKAIRAAGVSLSERTLDWTRRHRGLAATVLALWCLTSIMACVSALLIRREHTHTALALEKSQAHYRQARSILDRLGAEVALRLDDFPDTAELQRDVLSETLNYYDWFLSNSAGDAKLRGDVARTRLEIARLKWLTGDYAATHAAYAAALEALDSAASVAYLNGDVQHAKQLRLLQARGLNQCAMLLGEQGDWESAVTHLEQAQRLLETIIHDSDIQLRNAARLGLALTHNNRGVAFLRKQETSAGIVELEAAIGLLREVPRTAGGVARADPALSGDAELADAFSNLSVLLGESQRFSEAAEAAKYSIHLRSTQVADRQPQPERLAVTYNNLAALHWKAGDVSQALSAYRTAIGLLERAQKESPQHLPTRNRLAVTLNNLGMALASDRNFDSAERAFGRAATLTRLAVEANPHDTEASSRLAGIQNNLAVLLREQGRHSEAEELLSDALHLIEFDAQAQAVSSVSQTIKTNLESHGRRFYESTHTHEENNEKNKY